MRLGRKDVTALNTLSIGDPAPSFDLTTDTGNALSLTALRGRKVVLYFYPKDDTPGCTLEAHDFSSLRGDFEAADTEIVGISPDSVQSHEKFKSKHGLDLVLAADPEHKSLEEYGVWGEKSMYGKTFMGVNRTTVLIDREGRIARIWPSVKVAGHAQEVLEAARALP